MPKEAAAPEAPATTPGTPPAAAAPATGAPPEAPQTESPDATDWKARYEDLRPEADRRASLLADIEGRNGPEKQAQALAEHARIELEDEEPAEPEDEFDLPPDPNEEIAKIRQEMAERDEATKAAEFKRLEQDYIEQTVEGLEAKEKLKLSDEEYQIVVNHGLANRDTHDGKPDLEGGFKALKAAQEAARKRYAKSKNDTALAPVGTTGEPKIDLRNKEARQKLGAEAFEAAERSKET